MIVTKKFSFDLDTRGISPLMYAVQGDVNTRKVEISLFSNGTAWEIPDGTVVAVAYRKPDGTSGLYDKLPSGETASEVSGNVVTVMLAPQVLTCAGNVVASVVFYSQDMADTLATFSFQIHVEKNPGAGQQISNNYYALQNLEQVNAAYEDLLERVLALEQGGGSGQNVALTTAQINALDGMFKVCAFIKDDVSAEYNAFKTAFGITDSDGEEEPDEPVNPEVTLTSISATYSGGDVTVGTAVADLTGIVVTAYYSDGSQQNVTDYTLSGEIAEGSNTVTVTYQGKTATFSVNGTAAIEADWTSGTAYDLTGKITTGILLSESNGSESANETKSATDYLNCYGADYMYHAQGSVVIHFYDANKNWINPRYLNKVPSTVEVPESAVYFRLSGASSVLTETGEKVIPITKAETNCTLGVQAVTWESGEYDTTGALISSSKKVTNIFPIAGASSLTFGENVSFSGVALFDANQNFIVVAPNVLTPIDIATEPYIGYSYAAAFTWATNIENTITLA